MQVCVQVRVCVCGLCGWVLFERGIMWVYVDPGDEKDSVCAVSVPEGNQPPMQSGNHSVSHIYYHITY